MKLRAVENKARLAAALFVVALFLVIGLSLALYSQSRQELAAHRLKNGRIEAALLAARLPGRADDAALAHALRANDISGAAAIYSPGGEMIARASTLDHSREPFDSLLRGRAERPSVASEAGPSPGSAIAWSSGNFDVVEVSIEGGRSLVLAIPATATTPSLIVYLFSYQIIALIFGLGLAIFLIRLMLRPYRRIVEAAHGSPVRPSTARSESEFVVETFQALIDQLQDNERELARLHDLERKRAEKSERFNERLIANIPSGLVAINATGLVTSANVLAQEIFGALEPSGQAATVTANSNELHTLAIDYRAFFTDSPRLIELVGECLSRGSAFRREQVEVARTDGTTRHLGLSISPVIDFVHNVEGALCLMTDITEVLDLRERMKLQEGLANLGEMAAGLAHEFKNSLATIHGYIQLIDTEGKNPLSPAERHRTLDAMLSEIRLLASLITDFLNFARPQQLILSEVSLRSIIDDCVEEVRPSLAASGIRVVVRGRFAELAGDESMLRRAFVNLLRNGAEAIDEGSAERLIEVTGSIDIGTGRYAHVTIRDTGSGISPKDLPRIFIPFYTTKSRGYGIGLAIVQKILVVHGGDVFVEHSDEAGTTFHCRLPLFQAPSVKEKYQAVN
ncbi:MAG TPA: ATP-binding protein [Blastocatellia bacterium]|nr:ATP-binding protein [Blastocatellia bacterium]